MGPTLTVFFYFLLYLFIFIYLVGEGREDLNITITGHHRPASETPFKWRFAGVPMMAQHCWLGSFVIFQGIWTSIAKQPIFL